MSTILDSLKKSSDQRDSDNNSSINNFNFGSQNKSSRMRYLFLLLFIVIFAFGFYYYMKNYHYAEDDFIDNSEQLVEPSLASDSTKEKSIEPKNASLNNNKIAKPDISTVKQRVKDLESKKIQQEKRLAQQASKSTLKAIEDGEKLQVDSPMENNNKNKRDPNVKQVSRDQINNDGPHEDTKKRQVSDLEQRIKTQEQGIVKAVAPSEYQAQQQEYQYVHQLPFSIRKDLPKFKLNVHIYDKDPESRVAIINGVRFYIDDMIEETVLVKDIIQEGVLLDFNGKEFLVPR